MPKRWNLFQDVVAILQRQMAGDAQVEESAMLPNQRVGGEREVDVVITSEVAGHRVVVAVEATAKGRPATQGWVEEMVGKHADLPTDKLVLVANAGFSQKARELAEAHNAIPVSPEDLAGDDPGSYVIGRMTSLSPKGIELKSMLVPILHAHRPDGTFVMFENPPPDLDILFDGHPELATNLQECAVSLLRAQPVQLFEAMGLGAITEDCEITADVPSNRPMTATVAGEECAMFMKFNNGDGTFELHPIDLIVVRCAFAIHVADDMPLTHMRLGAVTAAYGETDVLGEHAVFVVTGHARGETITTRRRDTKGEVTDVVTPVLLPKTEATTHAVE